MLLRGTCFKPQGVLTRAGRVVEFCLVGEHVAVRVRGHGKVALVLAPDLRRAGCRGRPAVVTVRQRSRTLAEGRRRARVSQVFRASLL
jgi:hypothetical protein